MTKKAMKFQFIAQLKAVIWYIGIYALVVGVLSVIFHFVTDIDQDWMLISVIYSPKVYLLVMGVIYPLITMEQYVSRGLTRKQFFWALTGSSSIIALILIIPITIALIYIGELTPLFVVINLVQMSAFFFIGWTAVLGFQFGKWYQGAFGILCAIVTGHILSTIPAVLKLPDLAMLGITLIVMIAQLIVLPRIIRRTPIKI
jgi:hypothetical protein